MAGPLLRRSEWVVHLPPRGDGQNRLSVDSDVVVFAPGQQVAQRMTVEAMLEADKSRQLILLADSRDVLLLSAALPPLSGKKLKLALPNVIEDQVMQDPSALCIALGPKVDDEKHLLAAMDRAWLEHCSAHFEKRGFKLKAIWPHQLCLGLRANQISLVVVNDGLTLRIDGQIRAWHAGQDPVDRADAVESLLGSIGEERLNGFDSIDVQLESSQWKPAVEVAASAYGLPVVARGLERPNASVIDLLAVMGEGRRQRGTQFNWSLWKWPAWLAAGCLAVFLLGLNLDWVKQLQEQSELKSLRDRRFKQALPNSRTDAEQVMQLKRALNNARALSGQSGAEDFEPLIAKFSAALGARAIDALASVEYRDNRLRVKFQPGIADTESARSGLREGCERNGLRLQFDGDRELTATVGLKT